jgi:hypothetical protein
VDHQFNLHPGMDGIPFRTQRPAVPSYKQDDPDSRRPQVVTDMHVDVFDMGSEEQRARLADILSKCAKGRAYESSRSQEFDRETGTYKVLLIWGEFFLEDPQEARENEIREFS